MHQLCIEAIWETSIPVWGPKLWHPKKTFQVFFLHLYFNERYVEVVINDFTMHLIILKWLRIQKCRQNRKTKDKEVEVKEETVNKCFNSFNYVINHESICFFIYVKSLHCFL